LKISFLPLDRHVAHLNQMRLPAAAAGNDLKTAMTATSRLEDSRLGSSARTEYCNANPLGNALLDEPRARARCQLTPLARPAD